MTDLSKAPNYTPPMPCATADQNESSSALTASDHGEHSVTERKLALLKRAGLFGHNVKGCTIKRACTADDLRQAYRLVHDVYLATGFIAPDPSGMRVRIYETTAETATFVAKVDGKVVGVLSVVEDSPDLGLPSDCVFKTELDALRRKGRRLCEVTNQVVAEDYRKSAVSTELMRCAIAVSLTQGHHEAIASVSPSHNGFYELLGFRQIGSQRSYSQTIEDPVIAVSMDIDQYRQPTCGLTATAQFMRQFLLDGNQFLSWVAGWAQEARRRFLDPNLLKQLFVTEKNILACCSAEELRILHERWGHDVFSAVLSDTEVRDTNRSEAKSHFHRVRRHSSLAKGMGAGRGNMHSTLHHRNRHRGVFRHVALGSPN